MKATTDRVIICGNLPYSAEEAEAMAGTLLDWNMFRKPPLRISGEAVDIYKPDGSLLLKFRPGVLPLDLCRMAFANLKGIGGDVSNRGTASGAIHAPRLRADGTRSKTLEVDVRRFPQFKGVKSGIIGYMDRYTRYPFCRQTAFNIKSPLKWRNLLPFFAAVDDIFEATVPDRWAAQRAMADRTSKDYHIPDTSFTTVTVNRNFQTAVHQDAGDLKEGFGTMLTLQAGTYAGGETVFPQFGVCVDMRMGDVLCSDVHEWHGNMPIMGHSGRYQRIAVVCYYRSNMIRCGSAAEELQRAKRRKTGDRIWD